MNLLVLDYVVFAVLAISTAFALMRGFTKEVLSIFGWVAAAYGAIFFAPFLKPLLSPYIPIDWVVNLAALLIVFLAVLVGFSLLSNMLVRALKISSIGPLDRSLGIIFGALRGAFIVCIGYFVIVLIIPEDKHPDWIANAKTRPLLQTGTKVIITLVPVDRLPVNVSNIGSLLEDRLLPETPKSIIDNIGAEALRRARQQTRGADEKAGTENADKAPDKGYNQSERNQIDRLILNTGRAE